MNFITTLEQAEEFFRRASLLKEDTLENRLKIMGDMAKERKVFKQTDEQIKRRINGKKVLYVRPK